MRGSGNGRGRVSQRYSWPGRRNSRAECRRVWPGNRRSAGGRACPRSPDGIHRRAFQTDCGFSYRSSIFNTIARERYIVLSITYQLREGTAPDVKYPDLLARFEGETTPPTLQDVREAVREIRAGKGMLIVEGDPDCRSAGSFFKNPILAEAEYARLQSNTPEPVPRYPAGTGKVKTSAAWLIERAGFKKGFSIGAAGCLHQAHPRSGQSWGRESGGYRSPRAENSSRRRGCIRGATGTRSRCLSDLTKSFNGGAFP